MYATISQTMKTAVERLEPGTMTYAVKEIGDEENSYFNNKNRSQSTSLIDELARFVFTPDNEASKPTMIVNIAAHPDVAGLPVDEIDNGRDLSGDYVYYLGEKLEEKGYNFMFFNGAIAGIYEGRGPASDGVPTERRYEETLRYGHEIAYIALNLTNTVEQIEANLTAEEKAKIEEEKAIGGKDYTLWYENWEKVEETVLELLLVRENVFRIVIVYELFGGHGVVLRVLLHTVKEGLVLAADGVEHHQLRRNLALVVRVGVCRPGGQRDRRHQRRQDAHCQQYR
jgi:hypothetical protein